MKDLIERSYQAIRKRGKITVDTDMDEFMQKMEEELSDIYKAKTMEKAIKETVDLMNVCICALKHHGFDPIAEFEKCVKFQETRKD